MPEGWEWFYDILWAGLGTPGSFEQLGGPGEVALGWWQADDVFTDPCHWQEVARRRGPRWGPSVDER